MHHPDKLADQKVRINLSMPAPKQVKGGKPPAT